MTKDTALRLIEQYTAVFKSQGLPDTASELAQRWPQDGSEKKAMRWLGFAQGVAYCSGIYTLDELKEHSRRGYVVHKNES